MAFDWSGLREPAPGSLVEAREVAHCAVQWATKAARANLAPAPDDSHSALVWDAGLGALLSAPLAKAVRVGVHLASLELFVAHDGRAELLALEGSARRAVDDWLDLKRQARGLKAASGAKLPYVVPARALESVGGLAALARSRPLLDSRRTSGVACLLGIRQTTFCAPEAGHRPPRASEDKSTWS